MEERETLIERLAKERGISPEEMQVLIQERIATGLHNPDPKRRELWERIPCAGDVPTPEEYVRYVVEKLHADGRENELRRYLYD